MGRGGSWLPALLAFTLLLPVEAVAVVTFDLLHDTPEARDRLKDELSAPSLGGAAAAASPGEGGLEGIWFAREKYLQLGETERAHQQLQLLWEASMQQGVRNLPEYGAVLVREARRRGRAREYDQASRALGFARKIAPDYLPVYSAGAILALRRNPLNIVPVWEELLQGWRAARRSFRIQAWLAGSAFLGAAAGLAFLLSLATAVLFLREGPRIAHDLRESLPLGGSPRARAFLSWLLLATPVLAGLSPLWWVIIAGVLLVPYVGRGPRILLALGALYVFALPWISARTADFLSLHRRPLLDKVVQLREGHWTERDYAELRSLLPEGGGRVELAVVGAAARHLGRLEEAEAAFQQGLREHPDDPVLLNGLGNVALARQDLPRAVEQYTRAAQVAPRLFAPHYNLALAYREEFKFGEGETESRTAAELDPEATAYFAGLDANRVRRFTVDALPPAAQVWDLAQARHEGQEAAAVLWESLMLGPPAGAWPFVVAALLLLGGGHWYLRARGGAAQACPRCGRLFCSRCQAGRRSQLCSQCHHIFVKKEGVDAKARVQKMAEIKTHRRRERWVRLALAALAPGGAHLAAGRLGTGLLFLAPAAFFEARVLLGLGAYPSPWSLGGGASGLLVGAAALLFAALWAASLWLAWKMEE